MGFIKRYKIIFHFLFVETQLLIQSFSSVLFLERLIKVDVRRHTVFDEYAWFYIVSFSMNLIIIVVIIFGF